MRHLQALIFDVDGTLADTERDGHRVAFNQAFAKEGLDWDWSVEIYEDLLQVTGGKERIRFYLQKYRPDFQLPANEADYIARLHKSKTAFYTTMLSDGAIPLRPGVARLLDEARAEGLRLAIATTTTPENVEALLVHTLGKAAMGWFEVIAAGDVVPAKKPAPDIYQLALAKLGLEAGDCLAFEDSENGILSSGGAGLKTVITINDYTRQHAFDDACLVVDCLGEPGQPFSLIRGSAFGHDYVNMKLLQQLHQAC